MAELQQQALDIVLADPAVASVGSSVGASGCNASVNRGPHVHQPEAARRARRPHARSASSTACGRTLDGIQGIGVFMFAGAGHPHRRRARADSHYQFTLWSPDIDELYAWVPKVVDKLQQVPGIADVSTDREQGGLQANITIDRQAAARLGVRIQDIDNALNNAFSQRQISTIYTQRNQYRVILEVDPRFQRDPTDLDAHLRARAATARRCRSPA